MLQMLNKNESDVVSENIVFMLQWTPLLEMFVFYFIRPLKGTVKDNGLSNFILKILKFSFLFVMHNFTRQLYINPTILQIKLCPRCLYYLFYSLVCLSLQSNRYYTNHIQTLHLLDNFSYYVTVSTMSYNTDGQHWKCVLSVSIMWYPFSEKADFFKL